MEQYLSMGYRIGVLPAVVNAVTLSHAIGDGLRKARLSYTKHQEQERI
jgi:hypothetical protein